MRAYLQVVSSFEIDANRLAAQAPGCVLVAVGAQSLSGQDALDRFWRRYRKHILFTKSLRDDEALAANICKFLKLGVIPAANDLEGELSYESGDVLALVKHPGDASGKLRDILKLQMLFFLSTDVFKPQADISIINFTQVQPTPPRPDLTPSAN